MKTTQKKLKLRDTIDTVIQEVVRSRAVRRLVSARNHSWFFTIYFAHYIRYATAPFQREIFRITEDDSIKLAVICAFRGSAKSTIVTLSYALWSILGTPKKKLILILSQTEDKARTHLLNIKKELETNELLKNDLGPFQEEKGQWGLSSLFIKKFNAKISIGSAGQSIRGIRHRQHRPDLILIDDIEDLGSVKTQEGREKTFDWLTGEVIPAGDRDTKMIIVGNLLHEDSVVMRLKNKILAKEIGGAYREFPITDDAGHPLWPGKYPSSAEVEAERKKVMDDAAFSREYLLKIISNKDRVIQPNWIGYYDSLPGTQGNHYRYTLTAVDVAISEKENACFTALVSARVYGSGENLRIYILANPINERMDFPKTVEKAKLISRSIEGGRPTELLIEDVAYQRSLAEQLMREGYPAKTVPVHGDKRDRLYMTGYYIKGGKVLFSKEGNELLIQQITNFGFEKYCDLADAFSLLVNYIMEKDKALGGMRGYIREYGNLSAESSAENGYNKHAPGLPPLSEIQRMLRRYY